RWTRSRTAMMGWPALLAGWAGGAKSMAVEFGATGYSTPGTGGLSSGGARSRKGRLISRRDAACRVCGDGPTPSLQEILMRRRPSDPGWGRARRKQPGRDARPGWLERRRPPEVALLPRHGLRSRSPWAVRAARRLFPT